VNTAGGSGTAPHYVKLTRAGGTVTAYKSTNGSTWTTVGSQSLTMAATIYVGLAVSSHVDGALANATFSNTAITPIVAAVPPQQPASPTPTPTTGAATIRVLHWNLHHGNDPNNVWALPRQIDVIYNANADIISLNEVEKFTSYGNLDMAKEIATQLTSRTGKTWYQYMVPGVGGSSGIGNVILSKFPLSNQNVCQLSSSRNAVHATVSVNGKAVNIWTTHLAVESSSWRVAEVGKLLPCMSGYGEARMVAGDFNAGTGTPEIDQMLTSYVDTWAKATSLGVTANYSGNCDGCTRNSRIDYLFYSKGATNLVLKKAEIVDTRNSSGVMASDHKPMIVTFELK
jgi:endonuclease/exonuclease/phosphatase family metal-dependent hydrolase